MATPNRLAGTANFWINGRSYQLVGEAIYSVSKVSRETATGMDGVHGFIERPVAGYIEVTLRDAFDLSVASLNAMDDVTCLLELANGKIVTGRNMWSTEPQEVDASEGKFKVRFEGPDVSEN